MTPQLLTYQEAAASLRVSERSVKRLIADKHLRSVRVGGAARIRVADLDEYVAGLGEKVGAS